MKIQKYADNWKGRQGQIKTSGGGNFQGYMGSYDSESNTIDVWNGLKRTKIDADKIVSVHATSPILVILTILGFVGFCLLLLHIVKDPRDDYRPYRSERYHR